MVYPRPKIVDLLYLVYMVLAEGLISVRDAKLSAESILSAKPKKCRSPTGEVRELFNLRVRPSW